MAAKEGKIHVLEFNASSEYTLDKRRVISINGYNATFGPEIRVKSGDTLNLKLTNWICSEEEASKDSDVWKDYCSTALHFHGVVPLANEFDGIPGLTQPTIGYGEIQYGDGMRGVLIIECDDYDNHVANTINSVRDIETLDDGVVTMKKDKRTKELTDYEVQEKIITLSDWYTNWNLDILNDKVLSSTGGTDPKFDGSLINGKPSDGEAIKIGFNTKYLLLRIVNSGMSGTQVFHLDGFQLIVLEADGIMIKPFIVQTINLAVGQRYTIWSN
ncbi:CIH_HP2_G0013050.mRNA.1.CDS.1 [Saccharomyces cerevisiae]|nr:CIH_HP2_G0013050.mRNA.1.CDS.1 [Saccharomyces cerevisiae]CAI6447915.1 CIH_HP2_G0013050.mRNA.1.CDS.1 [Saccharomyces cerevisiae]